MSIALACIPGSGLQPVALVHISPSLGVTSPTQEPPRVKTEPSGMVVSELQLRLVVILAPVDPTFPKGLNTLVSKELLPPLTRSVPSWRSAVAGQNMSWFVRMVRGVTTPVFRSIVAVAVNPSGPAEGSGRLADQRSSLLFGSTAAATGTSGRFMGCAQEPRFRPIAEATGMTTKVVAASPTTMPIHPCVWDRLGIAAIRSPTP